MNLNKWSNRGSSLCAYDSTNKVLCIQWLDNKVVSLTLTLQVSGLTPVVQRSGSNVLNLSVKKALKLFQEGMDAVDRNDQYQERGSGFASKSHYKKWYKKAFFGIIDFMVLNSFFAWNMSIGEVENRLRITRAEVFAALSKEMIGYVDAQGEDVGTQVSLIDDVHGHVPIPANHHERLRCAVCKLEVGWMKVVV